MNLEQAYNVLGVSTSISDEDLKKRYKELARKFHPDVNKDDPNKFKEVNEAYQFIQNYKNNPQPQHSPFNRANVNINGFPFDVDFGEIFKGFGNQRQQAPARKVIPIELTTEISFNESVLGVEKEISFKRQMKCNDCNGLGKKNIKNDCDACDGFGVAQNQVQNIIYSTNCLKCNGAGIKKEDCNPCKTKGYIENDVNYKVNIPAGLTLESILNVQGAGHFIANNGMFGDMYGNVLLTVKIQPHPTLKLVGHDVICPLTITLLEALEGCKKIVPTTSFSGEQEIDIPSKSKNKEEIVIAGMGVRGRGDQKVILEVIYPNNIDEIIKILKEKDVISHKLQQ